MLETAPMMGTDDLKQRTLPGGVVLSIRPCRMTFGLKAVIAVNDFRDTLWIHWSLGLEQPVLGEKKVWMYSGL